jgi:hypothetical protein
VKTERSAGAVSNFTKGGTSVYPSAVSALQAFKHMNHNSAFRFHDRPDESELCSAETAVTV